MNLDRLGEVYTKTGVRKLEVIEPYKAFSSLIYEIAGWKRGKSKNFVERKVRCTLYKVRLGSLFYVLVLTLPSTAAEGPFRIVSPERLNKGLRLLQPFFQVLKAKL